MKKIQLFPKIENCVKSLNISTISEERMAILNTLSHYIKTKFTNKESIALNFICTHNSRRSHLSQVWAQAIAEYLGISDIHCYSGGTEATAMFPMAVETLKGAGFEICQLSEAKNPVYAIKYAANTRPIIGFSKTFDHPFNPKSNFGAIMTCSSADKGCPIIIGSDGRFPITYEDPKVYDTTPLQEEKYQERSIQIATELFYVFTKSIR